jgi:deazaflavin-dependent oxidoreductase (nitroreductase family)
MANSAPGGGASDYNTKIIEEFRVNQGTRRRAMGGHPDDSYPPHRRQVRDRARLAAGCSPQADRRFAIAASNGGSLTHPDWYYNLKANSKSKAEVGTQTFTVLAEELDDTARAGLWPKLVAEALPSANSRPGPRGRFRCSC